ncbi:hypothetical protein AADZ86_08430 [Colwelliaceae bacterium BS250]
MTLKVSRSLVISIILHALLIWFLLSHNFSAPLKQQNIIPKKKAVIINSYIFNRPKAKISEAVLDNELISQEIPAQTIDIEEIESVAAEVEVEVQAELETVKADALSSTEQVVKNLKSDPEAEQTKQSNSFDIQPPPAPQDSKPVTAIFSPANSMARFNSDLDQKMMDEHFKQHQQTQGISPMQALMPVVPKREYVKTLDEKIQEATTIIGNETFVKQDGVCAQTTDLGFIEEGLTSVTSYSDCGETDDERYFREFMKKSVKK